MSLPDPAGDSGDLLLDTAIAAHLERVALATEAVAAILARQHGQSAEMPLPGPPNGMTRLEPVTRTLPMFPDRAPARAVLDPWGRTFIRASRDAQAGPTFTIAAGATVSNEAWFQNADEPLIVGNGVAVIQPLDFANGFLVFDAPGRVAGEQISYQVTADRVTWNATSTAFLTAVGLAVPIGVNNLLPSRGIRLVSNTPVAAARTFRVQICGG